MKSLVNSVLKESGASEPLKFRVDMSNVSGGGGSGGSGSGGGSSDTLIIPVTSGVTYDCTIDWGDGNETTADDPDVVAQWTHVYSNPNGNYTVSISGTFPQFTETSKYSTSFGSALIAIDDWGTELNNLRYCFYGCENLTSVSPTNWDSIKSSVTDLFWTFATTNFSSFTLDLSQATSLERTFYQANVANFSSWDLSSATTVYFMFQYSKIQSVSSSLTFKTGLTSTYGMFSSCTQLTTIGLFTLPSSVTTVNYMFEDCNNAALTSFPAIDVSNQQSFIGTWQGMDKLTSFPELDFSSAVNLTTSWAHCTGLTSFPHIPTGKMPQQTYGANSAWSNCSSLTGFPALDMSNCNSFNTTWRDCSSITGEFPPIDCSNSINQSHTWNGASSLRGFSTGLLMPALTLGTTSIASAFQGITGITGTFNMDVSKCRTFQSTFKNMTNVEIISGVDFGSCQGIDENPSAQDGDELFQGCSSLKEVKNFTDTTLLNRASKFFMDCSSLTGVGNLKFHTGIANTFDMFYNCSSITSSFDVGLSGNARAGGVNMDNMYRNCSSLTGLNLNHFPPSGQTSRARSMFRDSTGLATTGSIPSGLGFRLGSTTLLNTMFTGVSLSTGDYSRFLIDLESYKPNVSNGFFDGTPSKYHTSASGARAALVSRGWSIADLGQA